MATESDKGKKTKVISVDAEDYDPKVLEEPAEALRRGKLVGLPTETVYGIGANESDDQAVNRLLEVRESPSDKKLSVHIADMDTFQEWCPVPPPMASRLAHRFWPGPLTLVLPHKERGTIGLRMPANRIALDLIRLADVPVVAPSANLSGDPPATNAEEVLEVFEGKIEYVIDGGSASYGTSSTVVQVDEEDWELLREGAISEELIVEESGLQILFVCSGNTCRSPMASGLAWQILEEKLNSSRNELEENGFRIESAGTSATSGSPATGTARRVLKEDYGISLRDHFSKAVTPSLITESDVIAVMTTSHRDSILRWVPEVEDRIVLLNESDEGIPDPIGGDLETYRRCAGKLKSSIEKLFEEIL